PFKYWVYGLWQHFIARRPCPYRVWLQLVWGSPSCTVSIFSCPLSATRLKRRSFLIFRAANPNP
ncbi:hypothetical protein DFP72DRAFT_777236, partial [Ephemerocybe angulata]